MDGLAASVNQWASALAEISQFRTSGAESAIEEARDQLRQLEEHIKEHVAAVQQLEATAQKAADAAQTTEQLKRCAAVPETISLYIFAVAQFANNSLAIAPVLHDYLLKAEADLNHARCSLRHARCTNPNSAAAK